MACRMTGKELAALRRRAELSQAALAKRSGVSRQTISYWENQPALDGREATLAAIARAFNEPERLCILNSRPGSGFVRMQMVGSVSPAHLRLFRAADAVRRATYAQMQRHDCGALTRRGMACKLRSEPGKARCRLHGGLSTGPKTAEGKARIAAAQRRRWAKHRASQISVEKT